MKKMLRSLSVAALSLSLISTVGLVGCENENESPSTAGPDAPKGEVPQDYNKQMAEKQAKQGTPTTEGAGNP